MIVAMGIWFGWTFAACRRFDGPNNEAATDTLLATIAVVGTLVYAVSAVRYWRLYRHRWNLLPAAVIACFALLAEAMIGVAVTGERKWHASWWEWHGLIVTAYLIIGLAVRREWRDERFRHLYLPTTRERTSGDQRALRRSRRLHDASPSARRRTRSRRCSNAYWGIAAPLITRRFGGEVEKFIGDGMHGDLQRHAATSPIMRCAPPCAALELQRSIAAPRRAAP